MLMAEFATAVKYQLPIKVVVLKNNTLGQIKWEQMVFLGNPEFGCDLQPIDFAAFARACGGQGFTIDDPAHLRRDPRRGAGCSRARADRSGGRPFRAAHAAERHPRAGRAFRRGTGEGQTNRKKIALTVAEDKVKDMV